MFFKFLELPIAQMVKIRLQWWRPEFSSWYRKDSLEKVMEIHPVFCQGISLLDGQSGAEGLQSMEPCKQKLPEHTHRATNSVTAVSSFVKD